MKEPKAIKNGFKWVPLDKRKSRFGGKVSPRKPEKRVPILWLARNGGELYLVNASKEILKSLTAESGGFQTIDDDAITVSSEKKYEYRDIVPNDAVKVEEYDGYYDLDYILQVHIRIQSQSLGCIDITSPSKKGGVGEVVLLWDSGEPGKDVSINKCKKA